MSTQPGVTSRPSASTSRRAAPSTSPTAVMMLPSMATSPVRMGRPEPSTMVPPRMIRSCMAAPLSDYTQLRSFSIMATGSAPTGFTLRWVTPSQASAATRSLM